MSAWGAALEPRPQHDGLCSAILAMARAAGARLAVRDAADGFIRLAPAHRTQLQQRAAQFPEHVALALEAWRLAEAAPGGAPLARLGAIAARSEERVLLGLLAAPQLDRAVARALRAVAHPDGDLTIGATLDLASSAASSRLLLSALFHPDAPLRRAGLVGTDTAGAALASTRVAIAPVVLAALRGEPVAAPEGAEAVFHGDEPQARALVETLGLPVPRPGTVTLLTGPRRATVPTLHLLMLATGRPAWLVPGGYRFREQAIDYWRWQGWARDAALADAYFVAEVDGLPLGDTVALARTAAAATGASLALLAADAYLPAVEGGSLVVIPCAGLGRVRAADGAPLGAGLPPGPLRQSLDALTASASA